MLLLLMLPSLTFGTITDLHPERWNDKRRAGLFVDVLCVALVYSGNACECKKLDVHWGLLKGRQGGGESSGKRLRMQSLRSMGVPFRGSEGGVGGGPGRT